MAKNPRIIFTVSEDTLEKLDALVMAEPLPDDGVMRVSRSYLIRKLIKNEFRRMKERAL